MNFIQDQRHQKTKNSGNKHIANHGYKYNDTKVQISVNGKTSGVYRDSFALDQLYERNLDYVVSEDTEEVVSTETP